MAIFFSTYLKSSIKNKQKGEREREREREYVG